MIDTCQAASMFQVPAVFSWYIFIAKVMQTNSFLQKFYSPNILAVASSLVGEDSLSHHVDPAIGVYIIDRFSCYSLLIVSISWNEQT